MTASPEQLKKRKSPVLLACNLLSIFETHTQHNVQYYGSSCFSHVLLIQHTTTSFHSFFFFSLCVYICMHIFKCIFCGVEQYLNLHFPLLCGLVTTSIYYSHTYTVFIYRCVYQSFLSTLPKLSLITKYNKSHFMCSAVDTVIY